MNYDWLFCGGNFYLWYLVWLMDFFELLIILLGFIVCLVLVLSSFKLFCSLSSLLVPNGSRNAVISGSEYVFLGFGVDFVLLFFGWFGLFII